MRIADTMSGQLAADPRSEAELVRAATAGELDARTTLFLRYHPMALGTVRRRIGQDVESDDLVHDAIVEALQGLPHLHNGQAFARWYGRVISQVVSKRMRRRTRERSITVLLETPHAMSRSASQDVLVDLARLCARDPEAALIIALRDLEGRSLPKVARLLGVSLSTVQRRIRFAVF